MGDKDQHKVAFITGAASGIGCGTAKLFAQDGYAVTLIDLNEQGGKETEEVIRQSGGESTFIACDVTDDDAVKAAVEQTVGIYGRLDAAFNAAGIEGEGGTFTADYTFENWHHVINTDLNSVFYCMRHQIPAMLKTGGGAIVNISSTAGIRGAAYCAAYAAAKHGVVGLTKTAALEYGRQGIRVNAICPGMIRTPMTTQGPLAPIIAEMMETTPLGHFGEPEDIGGAALWLCTDAARFVTGQAIPVDGALTSR